jgi:hypothetical protein
MPTTTMLPLNSHIHSNTKFVCCCYCIVCKWTPLISLQVMSRQWPGPGSTQLPGSAFVGLLVIATVL